MRLRDARVATLDEIGRTLGEIYGVFRGHLPPQAWERYIGQIVGVRSRLSESELIVAERDRQLIGTIGLYPDASRSPVERWPQRPHCGRVSTSQSVPRKHKRRAVARRSVTALCRTRTGEPFLSIEARPTPEFTRLQVNPASGARGVLPQFAVFWRTDVPLVFPGRRAGAARTHGESAVG